MLALLGVWAGATACKTYPAVTVIGTGVGRPSAVISAPEPAPPPPMDLGWADQTVRAEGNGAPPPNMRPAQARQMAKRAAVTDARRNLLEQIKGVSISSQTTVRDFMTESDVIRSRVDGLVRGAQIVDEDESSDGTYTVVIEVGLSPLGGVIQPPPPPRTTRSAGVAVSDPQAKAMALRAAEMDANRKLVETIYGSYVQSETSVTNFELDYDRILSRTQGTLRFAQTLDRNYNPATGEAEVTKRLDSKQVKAMVKAMRR
ncbi:LPP20 family lipoprotein [Candidatus Sumerlaeota bacterium]|nr:LPP20 family lipoprotein [Candidatus Sumerlaeota bacterium]